MNLISSMYARMMLMSFVLFISMVPKLFDAACHPYTTFLNCRGTLPGIKELKLVGMQSSVQIGQYVGELVADMPSEKDEYSVKSLQIQNSFVQRIEPLFFWTFSVGGLESLVLNTVNGTFELNQETLGRLENVLTSIRVSGRPIGDISYLANLTKLDTLYLGLTQLRAVPSNFGHLLARLNKVDLSKNELTSLPWDALARRIPAPSFKGIRLSENPWHCDCTLQPLFELGIEHLDKISGFYCATPSEFTGFTLREYRAANLCRPPPKEIATESSLDKQAGMGDLGDSQSGPYVDDQHRIGPAISPDEHRGSVGEREGDKNTRAESGEVASAGLSTEVIAVIVAIVVVVVIVLIAVIAFKARQNSRRRQRASQKRPSQKSSRFCVVVEDTSPPRGGSAGSKPTGTSVHNNYGRDTDHIERQPLAPGYRDNRL